MRKNNLDQNPSQKNEKKRGQNLEIDLKKGIPKSHGYKFSLKGEKTEDLFCLTKREEDFQCQFYIFSVFFFSRHFPRKSEVLVLPGK